MFPELRDCPNPATLPVDNASIESVQMSEIGLGKSIDTKKQLEEFATFQDNQDTRKAYLAETVELAYCSRKENCKRGLALGNQPQSIMIDTIGTIFILIYRAMGPFLFIVCLMLLMRGGFWLVFIVCLGVFSWIDHVLEEVANTAGKMVREEARYWRMVEG
jgi:hypothetical protein